MAVYTQSWRYRFLYAVVSKCNMSIIDRQSVLGACRKWIIMAICLHVLYLIFCIYFVLSYKFHQYHKCFHTSDPRSDDFVLCFLSIKSPINRRSCVDIMKNISVKTNLNFQILVTFSLCTWTCQIWADFIEIRLCFFV